MMSGVISIRLRLHPYLPVVMISMPFRLHSVTTTTTSTSSNGGGDDIFGSVMTSTPPAKTQQQQQKSSGMWGDVDSLVKLDGLSLAAPEPREETSHVEHFDDDG